jgi:SAM-dependent methyltransferase
MTPDELERWFADLQAWLEPSYLAATEPWRQSGFSGPVERWVACRRPIADCLDRDGAFLDIGCANGYLLECLLAWTAERGLRTEPWGVDLSAKLVALARQRLPEFSDHIFVGNARNWLPPRRFDYVRTELCYVPQELRSQYLRRLMDEFLAPGGRLLVPEYRSRKDPSTGPWIDEVLGGMGFAVESVRSGFWEGKELTRVAILPAKEGEVG